MQQRIKIAPFSWLSVMFYGAQLSEIDPQKYLFVQYSDQNDAFSSCIPTSGSYLKLIHDKCVESEQYLALFVEKYKYSASSLAIKS